MAAAQNDLSIEDEAAEAFFRSLQGEWSRVEQETSAARLASDPAYAQAYRRVEQAWAALEIHAESPQLLARRQEAIAYARQESGRRWLKTSAYIRGPRRVAAAVAGIAVVIAIVLAAAWQLSPYGYRSGQYKTDIGEQRIVELADHSRIELDAATLLQVRYSADARTIELKQGQAQFSVAKDLVRPFKVVVGNHTIVALGTVFTVDFANRNVHVVTLEGRVAVIPRALSLPPQGAELGSASRTAGADKRKNSVELAAGEELNVSQDGHATLIPKADLEAATAWREGKVIFRSQSLREAVQRLNRYSRVEIEIADESLADQQISGVFEAGDTQGFVRDIQRYWPVVADPAGAERINLRMKR